VRRRGVGYTAAESIWRQFPGPWEVRVIPANLPARVFWAKAIFCFLGKSLVPELVTKGEEIRYLFQFESKANPLDEPQ